MLVEPRQMAVSSWSDQLEAPHSRGMEGFSFNFFGSSEAEAASQKGVQSQGEGLQAEEVPQQAAMQAASDPQAVALDNGISILKGRVSSQQAAAMLEEPELQESDLLPQKYEGGFKLWEGSVDLCNLLIQLHHLSPHLLQQRSPLCGLQGKKVLELGCGHGLPGLLCLLAGAAVHFQDFNRQVITSLTIPNVKLNTSQLPPGTTREAPRFFSGDWQAVGQLMATTGLGGHYDVILTAETIYNTESQERLLNCIKQVLQPPHGVVYVAAKSFYFGVGGGTTSFADLVKADGVLDCCQVWKVEDGLSNKREILKLSFPEAITPYFL